MDLANEFIEKNAARFEAYLYYENGKIHREQRGIIRTNCLDSLDRTNVIQSKVGWYILKKQLTQEWVDSSILVNSKSNKFFNNFRELWSNNGNSLSLQYTGTESTTSDITKSGKEGFFGSISSGFRTVNRTHNNTH